MYDRLSSPRRYPAGEIDPKAVSRHVGDRSDFLERHRRECALALKAGREGLRKVAPHLLWRLSDERMLRLAFDHLRRHGGQAPGPDGLRFEDFDPDRVCWQACRALRDEIRAGGYEPGPERVVEVPKASGNGTRTLAIQSILDRVVQRAVLETLEPLLDPRFGGRSYGFRRGKTRLHALADAEQLCGQGRRVWLCEDIKDAFRSVPLGRLLQLVTKYLLADDLTAFVGVVLGAASTPGLRQGAPASPLWLNLFCHHFIDRRWAKRSETPLIRVADDLLLPCRTVEEARNARSALEELLRPTGLAIKADPINGVRTLSAKCPAYWMGFVITRHGNELRYGIAPRAWSRLGDALRVAAANVDPARTAAWVVQGWAVQMAPCLPSLDEAETYGRIKQAARGSGIAQVPRRDRLMKLWRSAYRHWCGLRGAGC